MNGDDARVRNALFFLGLIAAILLAVTVLLPVLGVIFLVALLALVLAVAMVWAAPLLAKLPWFRDRIYVREEGGRKTVRFGGTVYTSYRGGGPAAGPTDPDSAGRLDDGEVIDVEGRELPDKE